jgi:hypothetical protein
MWVSVSQHSQFHFFTKLASFRTPCKHICKCSEKKMSRVLTDAESAAGVIPQCTQRAPCEL